MRVGTTVLVGDGLSDRRGAGVADLVFAKGDLRDLVSTEGRSYVAFNTLDDVVERLKTT